MELLTLKQPIAIRPEHVASSPTTIQVKQHSASWSSGNFTVSSIPTAEEPLSKKLFGVDGDFASWSQRRHFCDASGLPLFEISRKKTGVTWYLHLPGESSSSSSKASASEPIATVVPKWSALKDKFDVRFQNAAANREETVLAVRGQDIWKSKTNVYYHGNLVMTVKVTDRVAVYLPGKRPSWEVVVAEGMDLSLASVLAVLLATMLYQSSEAPLNTLTNSSY
ncbi:tubby C-terminal-like domain-containing protein [Aspergillus varians]